jgi:hypothetical protein
LFYYSAVGLSRQASVEVGLSFVFVIAPSRTCGYLAQDRLQVLVVNGGKVKIKEGRYSPS